MIDGKLLSRGTDPIREGAVDSLIARLPVLDHRRRIYGYELHFRGKLESILKCADPEDGLSSKTISDSVFLCDFETYTAGKRAFVKVTKDILADGFIHILPSKSTVVEISASVEPTPEIAAACERLKGQGYLFAVEQILESPWSDFYVRIADIVKVPVTKSEDPETENLLRRLAQKGVRFLARDVETPEIFERAVKKGYSLFEGGFFKVPVIFSRTKDIPGFKLNYLRLIAALHEPEMDFEKLEGIIKREVSLAYKLLRYLNSTSVGSYSEIRSITHALALLGEVETKRWASLVLLTGLAQDKPDELVTQALTRARFCEKLGAGSREESRDQELFLMGMLSLMDSILDRRLSEILKAMPLADDVKRALLGERSDPWWSLECVRALERADWATVSACAEKLGADGREIGRAHREAVQWAQESHSTLEEAA
jgi:EAL and modified HD-GYP domain-containing signal transduction protein